MRRLLDCIETVLVALALAASTIAFVVMVTGCHHVELIGLHWHRTEPPPAAPRSVNHRQSPPESRPADITTTRTAQQPDDLQTGDEILQELIDRGLETNR